MRTSATLAIALGTAMTIAAQRYEWIRTPDAAGTIDPDMALAVDEVGNSYHAYSFLPPLSVSGGALVTWPGMGGYDIAVSKFDPQGAHVWTTTFGSVTQDEVHDIGVDASGAVYVGLGNFGAPIITEDTSFTNTTGNCIVKLDPSGHCRRMASFTGRVRLDAIRDEVYVSAHQTIIRLDTALTVVWSHSSSGNPQFDAGSAGWGTVAARGDRVVFTGFDTGGGPVSIGGLSAPGSISGNDQAVVVVFDTAGTGVWAYQSDGTNPGIEKPMDVAMDEAGNVYLGVESNMNPFQFAGSTVQNTNGSEQICALLKLGPDGNEEWAIRFQPTSGANVYSVAVNNAGEAVFAGAVVDGGLFGSFTMPVAGGLYVAKVAPDGTPIWLKDDFGGAQNGGAQAFWMDDGPSGDFWLGLRNFAYLTMDCIVIPEAFNFVIGRISDAQQVLPVANFSFVTGTLDVQFTDASTDASEWSWDFDDGNSSTEQDPLHVYAQPGTYTVVLTAINGACTSTWSAEVTVLNVGIQESSSSDVLIYPDPAEDLVRVRSTSGVEAVQVVDISGRSVLQMGTSMPTDDVSVDVSGLSAGTYVLRILAGGAWRSSTVRVR